jgi:hypothetical protein
MNYYLYKMESVNHITPHLGGCGAFILSRRVVNEIEMYGVCLRIPKHCEKLFIEYAKDIAKDVPWLHLVGPGPKAITEHFKDASLLRNWDRTQDYGNAHEGDRIEYCVYADCLHPDIKELRNDNYQWFAVVVGVMGLIRAWGNDFLTPDSSGRLHKYLKYYSYLKELGIDFSPKDLKLLLDFYFIGSVKAIDQQMYYPAGGYSTDAIDSSAIGSFDIPKWIELLKKRKHINTASIELVKNSIGHVKYAKNYMLGDKDIVDYFKGDKKLKKVAAEKGSVKSMEFF